MSLVQPHGTMLEQKTHNRCSYSLDLHSDSGNTESTVSPYDKQKKSKADS